MHGVSSLIKHDVTSITRDGIAMNFLAMMLLFVVIAAGVRAFGYFSDWYENIVILMLVSYMPGFGFLFGMLIVDEMDSGVFHALAVSPLRPRAAMMARVVMGTAFVILYGLLFVYASRMLLLPFEQWLTAICAIAISSPVATILVPAIARNKVEAMGLFKVFNMYILISAIYLFIPQDAWYSYALFVTPGTWVVRGLLSFIDGQVSAGYVWCLGGIIFMLMWLATAITLFERKQYKTAE